MSIETDDKSIEEIVYFLKTMIETSRTLRNSNGIIDCNRIRLFKYVTQDADSGFESEPISEHNHSCLVPAAPINKIIFHENQLDLIFEHSLINICSFIQKTNINTTENQSKIETILEFLIQFIQFLEEIISNVPFREIILAFLDSMVTNALTDENNAMINFVMELLQRFGIVQELSECIVDIIMKHLKMFAENLNIEGIDPSFSFHYENDFSRANTLLLTLLIMKKKYNCSLSIYNDEDICNILQTFAELDDFFSLGFLSYKCLLKE